MKVTDGFSSACHPNNVTKCINDEMLLTKMLIPIKLPVCVALAHHILGGHLVGLAFVEFAEDGVQVGFTILRTSPPMSTIGSWKRLLLRVA